MLNDDELAITIPITETEEHIYHLIIDKDGKIVETHQGYTEGDEFELQEKVEKLAGVAK